MKTSSTTKGLSAALAKALATIANPSKDATNPHFKSKYATLDGGLVVIREALSSVGISFSQATRMDGDLLMLDTRLMLGDEWLEGEYPVCKFPARQQEIGSALTYARRYSLFAIVGVAGEDDDDANAGNVTVANSLLDSLKKEMAEAQTLEALDAWQAKSLSRINRLAQSDKDALRKAYSEKRGSINAEMPEAAE